MKPLPSPTTDTPTIAELLGVLENLTVDMMPKWGTMNAPGMARHCTRFVDLYQGRVKVSRGIRLIAGLVGPWFLRKVVAGSPTATPKNLRTLAPLVMGQVSLEEMPSATGALRSALLEIEALNGHVQHVLYGSMDAESIRTLVRHHTAHHFHQFGLFSPE